jgi:TPP-dependent pyruvate/acetoin dehydrogenase alpha subunit
MSLDRADRGQAAALALIDRRWVSDDACRGALSLAGELALPLVVVAIDPGAAVENGSPVVDRGDFEWVRAAVAEALLQARGDRRASLVECAGIASPEAGPRGQVARFRTQRADPLGAYERTLLVNGLSRTEIDEVKRAAADELEQALADRIGAAAGPSAADAGVRAE